VTARRGRPPLPESERRDVGSRVGRPRKPPGERRDAGLRVRLTAAALARYAAAAESQGTDLATVARAAWERLARRAEREG